MRYLPLFTAILFAVGAHAQTTSSQSVKANGDVQAVSSTGQAAGSISGSAASQGRNASASATQTTNLSAELTKKIDTKHAKIGDEVVARTTGAAKLSDGTKLPKGTRLLGKVTDVQARSAEERNSRLAFTFDRAMLRNGRRLPIRALVMSLTAPVSAAAMAESDASMSAGAEPVPMTASGGGRASGGLLGGAVGGVARDAGGFVGNTARGVASTTGNTLHTVANAGSASVNGAGSAMENVSGQVTNLQGVSFSSDSSASQSTVVQAQGKNFSLASGTQMTLSVSASNQQ